MVIYGVFFGISNFQTKPYEDVVVMMIRVSSTQNILAEIITLLTLWIHVFFGVVGLMRLNRYWDLFRLNYRTFPN